MLAKTFKKDDKPTCGVVTRGGTATQDPLYPEGHPKRIKQDSQLAENNVGSSSKKKKKRNHKRAIESEEPSNDKEPEQNPNDISISNAETEDGNEPVSDIDKGNDPNKEESDEEPEKLPKHRKYNKEELVARKHGSER